MNQNRTLLLAIVFMIISAQQITAMEKNRKRTHNSINNQPCNNQPNNTQDRNKKQNTTIKKVDLQSLQEVTKQLTFEEHK